MGERGISVIVPTHDRWPLIRTAIDSVFAQSIPVDEIIVVDDASSDGTSGYLKEIGDERVRVIRLHERGGAPHARNVGIAASTRRYIAFLDSDDEWMPRYLETMLAFFDRLPGPIAVCSAQRVIRADGREYVARPEWTDDAFERLLSSQSKVCIGIVANRLGIGDARFDESLPASEERDFLIQLTRRGNIACSSSPLYLAHEGASDRVSDPTNMKRGLPMFVEKYRSELSERPRALASNYLRLARLHWFVGDRDGVRRYLVSASTADPSDPLLRVLSGVSRFGAEAAYAGFNNYIRLARVKGSIHRRLHGRRGEGSRESTEPQDPARRDPMEEHRG